jgi:uncharacterized protein
MACLSSRIPYGERVTPVKLRMIEEAESVLRDHGFYDLRVRHPELGAKSPADGGGGREVSLLNGQTSTHLARIELGPSEIPRLLENDLFIRLAGQLKQLGYAHVTLDLAGYRRGSLNETPLAFASPKRVSVG